MRSPGTRTRPDFPRPLSAYLNELAKLFLGKLPAFVPVAGRLVERRRYDRYIRRVRSQDRPR